MADLAPLPRPDPNAAGLQQPAAMAVFRQIAGWAVLLLLALAGLAMCFTGTIPQDEGELLAYPRLMLHGWTPYSHIWMMYPPATYWVIAALLKAGVPGLVAERGLGLAARAAYAMVVSWSFTGSWRRISFIGMPVAFLLVLMQAPGDIQIRAYPWLVGLPLLYAGLVVFRQRPLMAAVLFAVAGAFRFELAVSGLLALGVMVLLVRPGRGRYAAGAVLTLALSAVFYGTLSVLSGGDVLREVFVEPLLYVGPQRSLPLLPPQYSPVLYPFAVLLLTAPFALIVAGIRRRDAELIASNVALLPALAFFLHRADTQYLFWSATLVIPWVLRSLYLMTPELPSGRRASFPRVLLVAIYLLVVPPFAVYLGGYLLYASPVSYGSVSAFHRALDRQIVTDHGRTLLALVPADAPAERSVLRYLDNHSRRSDTLFVAPTRLRNAMYNATDLYYLTDLHPASRYLEMNPGVETRASVQKEIVRSLGTCRWIVLYKRGFWHEPSGTQHPGAPLLAQYIHRDYFPVLDTSVYTVLERRGKAAGA